MPGVGLGRLHGAGCSTVPMACGADELGMPAQPASSTGSISNARSFLRIYPLHSAGSGWR